MQQNERLIAVSRFTTLFNSKPDTIYAHKCPAHIHYLSMTIHNGFLDYIPELPVHFDVACSFGGYLNYI